VDWGESGSAVTAVANPGYHFVSWSDSSATNPRTDANVITDATYTATFASNAIPTFNTALGLSGPASLKLRAIFKLRGTITPAAAPGKIYLTFYLLKGSRWANYGRAQAAISNGKFAFDYKPPRRGKWRAYASYSRVNAGSVIYNKALTARKDFTVK
jgi:hypothetical protein